MSTWAQDMWDHCEKTARRMLAEEELRKELEKLLVNTNKFR